MRLFGCLTRRLSGLSGAVDFLRSAPWLTRARVLQTGIVVLAILVAMMAWDFNTHTTDGVIDEDGEHLARDFVNYWSGARLAADDELDQAYDADFFHDYQRKLVGENSEFKMYSYPPIAALFTLPLAALDFVPALTLWLALGTLACVLLLARYLPWHLAVLAALASPAVFINAISGQNGHFSAVLIAGGVLMLERRPILAGVFFGALCYKPHLGLLLPFVLAAGGYWRTFFAAAATVGTLLLASLALFGADAWLEFLRQASIQRLLMEQGSTFWHRMPTAFAAMRNSGFGIPIAYTVHILSAVMAVGMSVVVWRAACPVIVKGAVLVVGTMLITPYGWDYDLVALTFVVAWLARDAQRIGFMPWEKFALALLLTMPLLMGGLAKTIGLQHGPFILWLGMFVITRRALIALDARDVPEPDAPPAEPARETAA